MRISVGQTARIAPGIAAESGTRFGRWCVVSISAKLVGRPRYVLCECECGARGVVKIADLLSGKTMSCGCLKREMQTRKMSRYATARTWRSMWRLAMRGEARVCESWKRFGNFFEDMGPRPQGMRLVRKDPAGIFERANCRWS